MNMRKASGEAARILPMVPMESMVPERVANIFRGNLNVKTLKEPIKTQDIPAPIRILPKRAVVVVYD